MSDRNVTTDALQTLGSIISENEKRDAIHLAVEPVVAAHMLRPGEDVGFIEGGVGASSNPVGIVDPFIKGPIMKGQRFWLVVYPRKITSLRHVWEHPGIPGADSPAPSADFLVSKSILEEFAKSSDFNDYESTMKYLCEMAESGYVYGTTAYGEIPGSVWDAYERVTGKKVATRPESFSCSC